MIPLASCSRSCPEDDVPLEFPAAIETGVESSTQDDHPSGGGLAYHHTSQPSQCSTRDVRHASADVPRPATSSCAIVCICLTVMSLGALNNVLGKIRAKPLGACSYFSAIVNAGAYCVVYFIVLVYRIWNGYVPHDQLEFVYAVRASQYHAPNRAETTLWSEPFLAHQGEASPSRGVWREFRSVVGRCGSWKFFVLSGLCDGLANALGIIAQPFVPGPLFALMNQATLPMAAILSVVLLHKRYTLCQTLAICSVLAGGVTSLLPDLIGATYAGFDSSASMTVKYSLITVLGTIPTAMSSALKEKVFRLYAVRQAALQLYHRAQTPVLSYEKPRPGPSYPNGGESERPLSEGEDESHSVHYRVARSDDYINAHQQRHLDIFLIAACDSGFQFLFTPAILPIIHVFGQFRGASLSSFLTSGLECFLGYRSDTANLCHACTPHLSALEQVAASCESFGCCRWALYTYVPYILVNIAFNLLFLVLIVRGSAVVAFMSLKAVLPLSIILFAFIPWPLLTLEDTRVSPLVLAGLFIVCASIVWYRQATAKAVRSQA